MEEMDIPHPRDIYPRMSDEDMDGILVRWLTALQEMQESPGDVLPAWTLPVIRRLAEKEFLERESGWRVHCLHADCLALGLAEQRIISLLGMRPLRCAVKFLIEALGKLQHHDGAGYSCYRELLKILVESRVFVKLISISAAAVPVRDLERQLFGVVNTHNVEDLSDHILRLTVELAAIPAVGEEVLRSVLSQLIAYQKVHSCILAERFLQTMPSEVETALSQLIHHEVRDLTSPDREDHESILAILGAVYCVRPSLTALSLSSLEEIARSQDTAKRQAVVRCLATMLFEGDVTVRTGPLFNAFIMRFDDVADSVRLECAVHTFPLLSRYPEAWSTSVAVLKRRQWDPSAEVRLAIVKGIARVLKKVEGFHSDLLEIMEEKVFDTEPEVRRESASALALLYRRNASGLPRAESRYSWLATPILILYLEGTAIDRAHVERLFRGKLLRVTMESSYRMHCLMTLYQSLTKKAQWALSNLLENSFRALDLLRTILRKIAGAAEATMEVKEELATALTELSAHHARNEAATKGLIAAFNALSIDPDLCQELASALDPECEGGLQNLESSVSRLPLVKIDEADTSISIFHSVCVSATCNMVGSRDAKCLLRLLRQQPGDVIEDNIHVVGRDILGDPPSLLKVLSSTFTASFLNQAVLDELLDMLNVAGLVEHALCVLVQIAPQLYRNTNVSFLMDLVRELKERVVSGTLRERKLAVVCLCRMAVNTRVFFGKIVEDMQVMLFFNSSCCREALLTLGHIAHRKATYFYQTLADIFVTAVNTLVLGDKDPTVVPTAEAWCQYEMLSEKTKIKVECLKAFVRCILGQWTNIEFAQKGFSILLEVVDAAENGSLTPSTSDSSWLQYVAATSVLRLCCCINYSQALQPQQFQRIAVIPRDKCPEVRLGFLAKLSRYVESGRLPVQFLALFAHSAHEKDSTIRRWARVTLVRCILARQAQLRRKAVDKATRFMSQPDYMVPYAVHLLAHFEDFDSYTCVPALEYIKRCLCFLLVPLMKHSSAYEPNFYVDMLEAIKQTKDAQDPANESANLKLYAVCDVAVGVVVSKGFETPARGNVNKVALPTALFTPIMHMRLCNERMYLTKALLFTPPKRKGVDMSAFGVKRRATSGFSSKESESSEDDYVPRASVSDSSELRRSFLEHSIYSDYEADDDSRASATEYRRSSSAKVLSDSSNASEATGSEPGHNPSQGLEAGAESDSSKRNQSSSATTELESSAGTSPGVSIPSGHGQSPVYTIESESEMS